MDEIVLTSATRNALQSLQRTNNLQSDTSRRLSTGLKVERATDDPVAYFQSKALTDRVSDLRDVKDNIGQALSSVETALVGTEAIDDITQQLRGLLTAARSGSDEQRAAAAEQFDQLRQQISALAGDTSYQGTSLISDDARDLTVRLNETGSSAATVDGQRSGAGSLGIGSAADYNGFASTGDIDAAIADLESASASLRTQAAGLGSDVALLNTRETFTENINNTLQTGADKLRNADLNEDAARQLALNVRSQLGTEALQIAQQGQLGILQLF
ncbi:MAG: hypothetical protein RIC16_16305 [Rhodospirillales bacterium]